MKDQSLKNIRLGNTLQESHTYLRCLFWGNIPNNRGISGSKDNSCDMLHLHLKILEFEMREASRTTFRTISICLKKTDLPFISWTRRIITVTWKKCFSKYFGRLSDLLSFGKKHANVPGQEVQCLLHGMKPLIAKSAHMTRFWNNLHRVHSESLEFQMN